MFFVFIGGFIIMNIFKKQSITFLGLMLIFVLFLTACGNDNNSDNEDFYQNDDGDLVDDRDLVVGIFADPVRLDPRYSNDGASNIVNSQIFEALVTHDEDMNIVPSLADSWERIDDYSIEFSLNQNVYFHNGAKMTADDVSFSLARATESAVATPILGDIDPSGLEVVDEYTIIVRTYEPYAPLLASLAHTTAFIVSRDAYEYHGEDGFEANPIGTGPFIFESWDRDERVTLTRNDNYWGTTPVIGGIEFRVMIDEFARVIALETGEIDIAWPVNIASLSSIEANDDIQLLQRYGLGTTFISLNLQREDLFGDVRVRQALNYAVDLDLIIETILEGHAQPSQGPMGANIPGASDNIDLYPFDPDRARELLAEAGFENGFSATIYLTQNNTDASIAEVIAAQLRDVGITLEIQQLELSTFQEYIDNGNHDMAVTSWTSVTGDPDYAVYPLLHSTQHGSAGNRSFYASEEADTLMEQARATFDDEERAAYYAQIQQLIVDEAPWIFLHNGESLAAMGTHVEGYTIRLNGQQIMKNVRFVD